MINIILIEKINGLVWVALQYRRHYNIRFYCVCLFSDSFVCIAFFVVVVVF